MNAEAATAYMISLEYGSEFLSAFWMFIQWLLANDAEQLNRWMNAA